MPKHIAYFVLKKNYKTFKKGTKTQIRKSTNSFFEINKRTGKQIKFRQDKWNKDLFEPIYVNINLSALENKLIKEFNNLLELSVNKRIEKLGLFLTIYLSWADGTQYTTQEIGVSLDSKFYKTKIEKEIGYMLADDMRYSTELLESMIKKELKEGNKRINDFLNKCDSISEEVGFDVFENFLN